MLKSARSAVDYLGTQVTSTRHSLRNRDLSPMAKTSKKTFKITPSSKRRSRADVVKQVSMATELKPGKVKEVLGALTAVMAADLGKKGSGEFNFNGLIKLRTVDKPATKARKGRNPFTGEEIMIKAKPASRKVRARALRSLNGLI